MDNQGREQGEWKEFYETGHLRAIGNYLDDYVGCDVGCYYTDNTFAGAWQPYFVSLPNVPIFDLM